MGYLYCEVEGNGFTSHGVGITYNRSICMSPMAAAPFGIRI